MQKRATHAGSAAIAAGDCPSTHSYARTTRSSCTAKCTWRGNGMPADVARSYALAAEFHLAADPTGPILRMKAFPALSDTRQFSLPNPTGRCSPSATVPIASRARRLTSVAASDGGGTDDEPTWNARR